MDLGVLRYRCQGANSLHGAVHSKHGLAWTEGRSIFLTPISLYHGQVENQEHTKLGEFDENVPRESRGVKSIHWSDSISEDLCYMCVVHDKNISIWKVEGQQPKLAFKQVRKVNIQPITQGCLWCPDRDLLCVLCPQQASVYYKHTENKGSQVLLQTDTEKIRCGCWTKDGSTLAVCVGTTLMIFHWSDVDSSVASYSTTRWTPGLVGKISSIVPVSDTRVLLAAELPLAELCVQKDTFVLPDLLNSNSNRPINEGHIGDEIIRPTAQESSVTQTLFNLPRNPDTICQDSCRLLLVDVTRNQDPEEQASCTIAGVLTPDLLLYQVREKRVFVGCNTQPLIQVFTLTDNTLVKSGEIELDRTERPKGFSCVPQSSHHGDDGILVLIGRKENTDSAFPSSTSYINMKSVLKFFNVKQGGLSKQPLSHTMSVPSIPVTVATNGDHGNQKDYEGIYESVMNFSTDLKSDSRNGMVDKNVLENNNSVHKPVSKSTSVLVNNVVPRDLVKVTNGSHRNSYHGDVDCSTDKVADSKMATEASEVVKTVLAKTDSSDSNVTVGTDDAPVAPKRPLRKKRSLRVKEDVSRKSSNSSQSTSERSRADSGAKMAMEYFSDSSELSPRDSPGRSDRPAAEQNDGKMGSPESVKNELRLKPNEESHTDKGNSVQTEHVDIVTNKPNSQGGSSGDTSNKIIIQIGSKPNADLQRPGIVEINPESQDKPLEIETVEFASQPQSFKPARDFNALSREDDEAGRHMERFVDRKFRTAPCDLSRDLSGAAGDQATGAAGPKLSTSLESLDDIDKILKEQHIKISQLQEQMNRLSRRVDESSCVLPTRYKSFNKPDTVQLCFRCTDGFKIEKKFLLDNGRLQLDQIKHAFSLETVEMIIDEESIVMSSNIDGYIPVRFEPGTSIYISGKPALH